MSPLDTFKTEQESLEFILPGKGALDAHPQRMNGGVEQAFASALRGLAVTGILFDVGVAYPLAADNVLGLLPCRLRGVNQPVMRHSEQVFKTSSSPVGLPLDTHGTLNVTMLHPASS